MMTNTPEYKAGYAAGITDARVAARAEIDRKQQQINEAYRINEEVRINAIRDRIMDRVRKMNEQELRRLWIFIMPPLVEQA